MYTKNLTDALLTVATPLPAAGASVTSNFLDLLQGDPTIISNMLAPERIELKVVIPALPNSKSVADNVTATFVDSADGVNSAPIVGLAPFVVLGVAGTGSPASQIFVRPPPTTRRYVGVTYSATAGAGNNTASNGVFQFAF